MAKYLEANCLTAKYPTAKIAVICSGVMRTRKAPYANRRPWRREGSNLTTHAAGKHRLCGRLASDQLRPRCLGGAATPLLIGAQVSGARGATPLLRRHVGGSTVFLSQSIGSVRKVCTCLCSKPE